jgi:RNA polymerase sigma factor (sigma-70 family)
MLTRARGREMQFVSTNLIQAWLDRHCAGENPSPNELCRLCEDRVRQLVRPQLHTFPVVVQDSQTTEVVNETFLRFFKALGCNVRLQSILDLERFLARIIRRVLLDMQKAIQRRRRRVGSLGEEPIAAPADADDPVDADLMVAFHEYIEALPPDEQALFDVFYYQGKSKIEGAQLLGLPPTTAHTRWVKARYRASKALGRDLTE